MGLQGAIPRKCCVCGTSNEGQLSKLLFSDTLAQKPSANVANHHSFQARLLILIAQLMATFTITMFAQGWNLDILAFDGVGPTISSDRGELNLAFTTPAPGQINIRADSDIMLPDQAGGGLGERFLFNNFQLWKKGLRPISPPVE